MTPIDCKSDGQLIARGGKGRRGEFTDREGVGDDWERAGVGEARLEQDEGVSHVQFEYSKANGRHTSDAGEG